MAKDCILDIIKKAMSNQIEKLIINGESAENITEIIKKIDVEQIILKLIESLAENTTKELENKMYKRVLEQRCRTNEFLARQEQKWGDCFIASETMYIMSVEAAQILGDYIDELDEINDKKYSYLALREIHGRGCQQYLEILCLIRNGFADGAFARWRSMYELSVIANFIYNNGEDVAKAFIDARDSTDRYEWARSAHCFKSLDKKYISFNDIQKQCDFTNKIWKDHYNLANIAVHASAQGTFGRLGEKEDLGVTMIGHSDYGIEIPAENSAISLKIISTYLLVLFPTCDGGHSIKCLDKWIDIIRKLYFEREKEIFGDEDFEPIIKSI